MSIGAYGLTIPTYLSNIEDLVDITYCYHSTRSYDDASDTAFKTLDASVLKEARDEDGNVIDGMYTLQLPLGDFNKKGFYTVYIRPKEVKATISDVGSLAAFPDVRGIVIKRTDVKENDTASNALVTNNGLVGYRVIYLDDNGNRQPYYRIITSNNKCEPIVQSPTTSSDKSVSYRYEDSSSLSFITVSPSAAPSFKDNQNPYIGKVSQEVLLVNTLFEPISIDIEMVTHDADTISYMLEGSQLRDLDNGLVTTFNEKNEPYHQSEHFTLKDKYNGKPIYEVKENKRDGIDFSQTIEDKTV